MFLFLSLILLKMVNGFIPITVLKFGGTSIGSPERIKGLLLDHLKELKECPK